MKEIENLKDIQDIQDMEDIKDIENTYDGMQQNTSDVLTPYTRRNTCNALHTLV